MHACMFIYIHVCILTAYLFNEFFSISSFLFVNARMKKNFGVNFSTFCINMVEKKNENTHLIVMHALSLVTWSRSWLRSFDAPSTMLIRKKTNKQTNKQAKKQIK